MNIIRIYNQNRRKILLGILVLIFIIAFSKLLNNISKEEYSRKAQAEDEKRSAEYIKEAYKENPDINVTISNEKVNEDRNLIVDQFIRYCNAKDVDKAYDLLSDDCQKYVYTSKQSFEKNYINRVYNTTKLYKKEKYYYNTYVVNLYEDMLSTGKVTDTSIEDYYTIVNKDGSPKLNISGYIGLEEQKAGISNDYISVNVLCRNIYREYEEYTMKIRNLTTKEIKLDSLEDTRCTYMTDSNGLKYYAMLYELLERDITIPSQTEKEVKIKFSKVYGKNSNIKTIVFSDIILDNKIYSSSLNKKTYNDRSRIMVNI